MKMTADYNASWHAEEGGWDVTIKWKWGKKMEGYEMTEWLRNGRSRKGRNPWNAKIGERREEERREEEGEGERKWSSRLAKSIRWSWSCLKGGIQMTCRGEKETEMHENRIEKERDYEWMMIIIGRHCTHNIMQVWKCAKTCKIIFIWQFWQIDINLYSILRKCSAAALVIIV